MEIMISRILKYLNGCLDNDHMYKIGNFVVKNYTNICRYSKEKFLEEGNFTEDELTDFYNHLGYCDYETFRERLLLDHQLRLDQIHARLLNLDINQFVNHLEMTYTNNEFLDLIDKLCDLIFEKKRIIIVGALYPSSVAVDFQTDMITLGKNVIEFHQFDKDLTFSDDDIVLFMTATGRMMESFAKNSKHRNVCDATFVLLTQNIKYRNFENVCADYVVHVTGKFDGIQFNYQIMMILDVLRISYYLKYYI